MLVMNPFWCLLLASLAVATLPPHTKRATRGESPGTPPKAVKTDACQTLHAGSYCSDSHCVNLYWLEEPVGGEAGLVSFFLPEQYEQLPIRLDTVSCSEAEVGDHEVYEFMFRHYAGLKNSILEILHDHIVPSLKWFPFQDIEATGVLDRIEHINEYLLEVEDEDKEEEMVCRALVRDPVFLEFKTLLESLATSVAHAVPRKQRSFIEILANYAKLAVDIMAVDESPQSNHRFQSATHQLEFMYPAQNGVHFGVEPSWFQSTNNDLPGEADGVGAVAFLEKMRKVANNAGKLADSLRRGYSFQISDTQVTAVAQFSDVVRAFAFHEDLMRSRTVPHLELLMLHFNRTVCHNLNYVVDYLMAVSIEHQNLLIPTIVDLCRVSFDEKLVASVLVNRRSKSPVPKPALELRVPGTPLDRMVERSLMYLMDSSISFGTEVIVLYEGNENVGYIGQRKQWLNDMIREVFRVETTGSVFTYSDDSRTQIVLRSLMPDKQMHFKMLLAAGRLMGLAIRYDVPLGVQLAPSFVKLLRLVSVKPSVDQYDELLTREDPAFLRGLRAITPVMLREDPELLPFERLGGLDDEFVSEDNLEMYIQLSKEAKLFVDHSLAMSIVRAGIMEVIGGLALNVMTEEEIADRLCARAAPITAEEIWNGMIFRNFDQTHDRIKNDLRQYIFSLSEDSLVKFHAFATGISRLPLDTSRPWIKVFMENSLNANSLPRSHICHNELQVPPYRNLEELATKFNTAIHEGVSIEGHAAYGTEDTEDH